MTELTGQQWQGGELLADGLDQARRLVQTLEAGRVEEAGQILNRLCRMRENSLYQDIGRLARDLHRSLSGFHEDLHLHALMINDMPDVRERLDAVIRTTEKSAHQTLTAIESCGPLIDDLAQQAAELRLRWSAMDMHASVHETPQTLVAETGAFLDTVARDTEHMRGNIKQVLIAQSFQDLTGQDIQRVISTVLAVESSLLDMLRTPDEANESESGRAENTDPTARNGIQGGAALDQDDVDDLLGSLGF